VARRYLSLEGRRVLHEVRAGLPLTAMIGPRLTPQSATAGESLEIARSRGEVDEPPVWFGAILPSRLLVPSPGPGARASDRDLLRISAERALSDSEDDDDTDSASDRSRILRLFEAPVGDSSVIADFLRRLFGRSRSEVSDAAGGELSVGTVRRTSARSLEARPAPTHIRFTDNDRPGAAVGVGGAWHPEWDVYGNRYRPDWCRVLDFPLTAATGVSAAPPRDEVLRQRLSRVGLGPQVRRRRPDGDDLDIGALTEFAVDVRSGRSPSDAVYTDRRKLSRELGVLILVDASGSGTDADAGGRAVHDLHRHAAATLAATLEELGDRVAVYAFRSQGRHAAHLPAVKTFGQRFGLASRARLHELRPSGYTRLGAGIRGAGHILQREAGTPNRLLLVLSDGYPYDHSYEGRYAEADTHRALEELRADGVACLCLSLGSTGDTDALERVFGSASHAAATTLAELSAQMDTLFLSALAELAAPRPCRR
jgi:nitric oxide reductase activation protein